MARKKTHVRTTHFADPHVGGSSLKASTRELIRTARFRRHRISNSRAKVSAMRGAAQALRSTHKADQIKVDTSHPPKAKAPAALKKAKAIAKRAKLTAPQAMHRKALGKAKPDYGHHPEKSGFIGWLRKKISTTFH